MRQIIEIVSEHLIPERRRLVLAASAMAARAGVLVFIPWPLKYVINCVILDNDPPYWLREFAPEVANDRLTLLYLFGAAMLVFAAVDALLDYLGNRLFLEAGQRIVSSLRQQVFAHLLSLPLAWHRGRRGGDLMTRLSEDIGRIQDLVAMIGTGLLPHALTIAGIFAMMIAIDWRYALLAVAILPALAFVSSRSATKLRLRLREARRADGDLWAAAQETLTSLPLVQASGREGFETRRFARHARQSLECGVATTRTQAQLPSVINLLVGLGTAAITLYGAERVLAGSLTPGDLLLFLAYLRGLVTPVRQLTKGGPVIGRALVAVERIREVLVETVEIADPPDPIEPERATGQLEFRNVSFSYGAARPTLSDVSFRLEPGRRVALVGPTGAGKSTLAGLAARLADPDDGEILLNGQDLRRLRLSYVRRRVALMLQDAPLLHGTVWENIAYSRPAAGREEAIDAAIAAGVDEILGVLPEGYDTLVSERGASLSGGQRQCVAIARATLADADIVILDEPSSSLDAASEQRISERIGSADGKSGLASYRPSACDDPRGRRNPGAGARTHRRARQPLVLAARRWPLLPARAQSVLGAVGRVAPCQNPCPTSRCFSCAMAPPPGPEAVGIRADRIRRFHTRGSVKPRRSPNSCAASTLGSSCRAPWRERGRRRRRSPKRQELRSCSMSD